jgi:hypothetical protein
MRSGDPEADAVYNQLIRPTIRRVGLTPRRVDRVMHNERIDQKILKELQACQLVVSDLTFARPSVYWEAGFAEGRGVEVVYTCKKDHLTPQVSDKFGNFKVHFDLQTKNIITWTSPRDHRFPKQLEGRLRYVLQPLLKKRTQHEQRKHEEEAFAAFSMNDRRERVVDIAIHQAHRLGLRGRRQDADIHDAMISPRWFYIAQYAAKLACDQPHTVHTGLVLAVPKLTKSVLLAADHRMARPIDDRRAKNGREGGKHIADHVIVASFAPVSQNLVSETLPHFQRDIGKAWPVWSTVEGGLSSEPGFPRRVIQLHVASDIRSESKAREILKQVLSYLPGAGSRGSH